MHDRPTNPSLNSLLDRFDRLCGVASRIARKTTTMADIVGGPVPTKPDTREAAPGSPAMLHCMARNVDAMESSLDTIEAALTRAAESMGIAGALDETNQTAVISSGSARR